MYIESVEISYPSRTEYSPVLKQLIERPDYDFPIIEIQWFDVNGEHRTPASQELLDRAIADGETDQAIITELRIAFE